MTKYPYNSENVRIFFTEFKFHSEHFCKKKISNKMYDWVAVHVTNIQKYKWPLEPFVLKMFGKCAK